jgi:ATP-dependent Zn protease
VAATAREPLSGDSAVVEIVRPLLPFLMIAGLIVFLMRRSGAASGLTGCGRARVRRHEPSEGGVLFADVAGIDEAK